MCEERFKVKVSSRRHTREWQYSSTIRDLSFSTLLLYRGRKNLRYPLDRSLGGPGRCGVQRNYLPLLGIEPQPSSP
jgi:hypothetical protein